MASRAGTVAQPQDLVDLTALLDAYYDVSPDLGDPGQRVVFGTSGHRGSSLKASFNEPHILAITQAIVEYRAGQGITGPLYLAKDTHALSEPAQNSALEVLAANGVNVLIDARHGYTPTPSLSHAILTHNNNSPAGAPQADGIVVTPSHNPPGDGGFKYNPPHGGPADSDATGWIANRANELLENGLRGLKRIPIADALSAGTTGKFDFLSSYVDDLPSVLDLNAIRDAGVRIGADPMGGASVDYWGEIGERHHLNLTVVNPTVDPQWAFMTLDWDEKIRMDCSSPSAMAFTSSSCRLQNLAIWSKVKDNGVVLNASVANAVPSVVSGDLDAIVMMALRKEPADRYGSADLLWQDLQRYLDGLPVLAGLSRKRMIGVLTGRGEGERLAGSLAAAVVAAINGARIIRAHDVRETVDALAVLAAASALRDNRN